MRRTIYLYKPRRAGGKKGMQDDLAMGDYEETMLGEEDSPPGAGGGGGERGEGARVPGVQAQSSGRSGRLSQITADRPIFTLSVAADLLGLHPRTLRIYEEKKLVVPARTEGNRRRYSQNDIQRFQFIRRLTRGGVNLEGVRIILDMADELTRLGGDAEALIKRNLQALDEW
ncbi:MAG TPA: MerR family transcriptional regulator [Chloroflexia bacterium]|nr:MerR family transcriptional regulator [Chloroflexia bacterium]